MNNYSTELLSNINGKKIIITGYNGYIGNEVSNQLDLNNIDYIGIDKTEISKINCLQFNLSDRKKLKDCMIFTGGPTFKSNERELAFDEYRKISKFLPSPIRKMGSAALDIAYVAAGRADGYFQRNLKYWDIAAGIILIKEAGGLISDYCGKANFISEKKIIASNSSINTKLI